MPLSPNDVLHAWFEEVWNKGDDTAIDRFMAGSAEFHGLPTPDGRPIIGPDGFRPLFRSFRSAIPDIHVRVTQMVSEGDLAVAHCRVTGCHVGDGLGIPATAAAIAFDGMCLAQVRDGQIVEGWNCFDFLALYQQIGLIRLLEPVGETPKES